MTMDTLLWICSIALMLAGVAGTVLPVLPGTALILAGMMLGAWIDGFTRVSGPTVGVLTALAVVAWVLDYVSGLMGAKRAGASKGALIGAVVGMVVGLFMGLIGVLFMPLVAQATQRWHMDWGWPGTAAVHVQPTSAHFARHSDRACFGAGTVLALLWPMSRLVRNRNRAEYLGAGLEAIEVEPPLGPRRLRHR